MVFLALRSYPRWMQDFDLVVCPPNAHAALPHGETDARIPAFSYTMTWNLTGWPGAVVRAGTSPEGLPVGAQLVAAPWREDVALAAAARVEAALGGWRAPAGLAASPAGSSAASPAGSSGWD